STSFSKITGNNDISIPGRKQMAMLSFFHALMAAVPPLLPFPLPEQEKISSLCLSLPSRCQDLSLFPAFL
ncbi:MAG: hypothetical protein SOH86_06895, partial [Erysipelotrichaceae bacterium]